MSKIEKRQMELTLNTEKIKRAAHEIRAVNNPLRQKILKLIHKKGKISVSELYSRLQLEQSVTSQHLAILRRSDFVTGERDGRIIYYSINYQRLRDFDNQLTSLLIND